MQLVALTHSQAVGCGSESLEFRAAKNLGYDNDDGENGCGGEGSGGRKRYRGGGTAMPRMTADVRPDHERELDS